MNKRMRILLILIAVICFGVALSYPISEYMQRQQSMDSMDMLAAMRDQGLKNAAVTQAPATEAPATDAPDELPADEAAAEPDAQPVGEGADVTGGTTDAPPSAPSQPDAAPAVAGEAQGQATDAAQPLETAAAQENAEPAATLSAGNQGGEAVVTATPEPTTAPTPSPTPDRRVNNGIKTWNNVEKIALDESKILPQYRDLYALNNEMVGWLTVSATKIDYPVMQTEDDTYYLTHDFMHNNNANGLLILDSHCDAYTPSYNLVVSGHNRKNNTMFSDLYEYYKDKRHWEAHKTIQFDSLMEERTYIVFAAFFSADYDVDEEGFRYNADIQYNVDMNMWLSEINQYKLYDTGIDVKFGDQVLTLTTCNSTRRQNGRFVVVCRRLREGEVVE